MSDNILDGLMAGTDDTPAPAEPKARKKREPKAPPGTETRRTRIPYGSNRTKLSVVFRDGFETEFHPHWINEENIDRARIGGYTFCTRDDIVMGGTAEMAGADAGSNIRQLVGRADSGKPQYAYLMKIPREYYEQDVAERQKEIDHIQELTKSGVGVPIENATKPNIVADTKGYRGRT